MSVHLSGREGKIRVMAMPRDENELLEFIRANGLGQIQTTVRGLQAALATARGWSAEGTNTVTGGTPEVLEAGTEIYDPEGAGSAVAYTVPRAGAYAVWAWCELQNVNAGAEVLMSLVVNGSVVGRPLVRDWNSGAAGASAIGGGHFPRVFAKGDVITAQVSHSDGVNVRSVFWRLTVLPLLP